MFSKIWEIWNERGFEIMVTIAVVFIVLYGLYRRITGQKGSWTDRQNFIIQRREKPKRQPPRESKGELECRRVLESLFSRSFAKSRPDFLRNPVTGNNFNLELDCYNPELHIAVEYNGVQHYQYVPYFHKNKEAFLNQKYRDDMKRRICKENNILLIEVPHTVKTEDIRGFLVNELTKVGAI